MLHRMTTLLSTVVVASLAALVLNVFPAAARAADNCFARPAGNLSEGGHWYFQTNRITRQKCWVLRGKKIPGTETAAVRNAAMQGLFNLTSFNALAGPATATGCIAAPKGRGSRGGHWHYRIDDATGQRCWWRSGHIAKARIRKPHVSEARKSAGKFSAPSPGAATLAAPATHLAAFQRAFENARAEFLDRFNVADMRIEPASFPASVTMEAANVSFASRWSNLLDPAPSADRLPGLAQLDLPVPAVLDDVTNSTKAGDRLFTAERSVYVTLLVFLAALLGALVLFGLIGGMFLYLRARNARSAPPDRPNPPPEGGLSPDGDAASAGPDRRERES